jgi:hypothetical protein
VPEIAMSSSALRRFAPICGLLVLARAALAGTPPPLVVVEPESIADPVKHVILTQDDGTAAVRLRWSASRAAGGAANLWITPLRATGRAPVSAGIDTGGAGSGGPARALRNVVIPARGLELRLSAPGLVPDVDYEGVLTIALGEQLVQSTLQVTRPGGMPPFQCPTGRQLVAVDGRIPLEFLPLAPLGEGLIDLRLSNFTSSDGQTAVVGFDGSASGELRRDMNGLRLDGARLTPALRAVGLAEGTVYTGTVMLLARERGLMECPLDVLLPRALRGELAADTPALTRSITLPFWERAEDVKLSLRLFEKTRTIPVDGVAPILDGAGEAPDGTFDPARHLSLSLDPPESNASRPVDRGLHVMGTLPPAAGASVVMSLGDLQAGKYAFALRFTGANATGTGPKVDVTVNVRHHWLWALLAVAVSLALSFLVNMGIGSWRDRRAMLDRLDRIRPAGRKDLASAVFLEAVCLRTKALIGHVWILPLPASVAEYMARAERVAEILRRYSSLQEKLEALPSGSAEFFCRQAIDAVIQRIGPEPLEPKEADEIVKALDALADRLGDAEAWYKERLRGDAERVLQALTERRSAFVLDKCHQAVVNTLLGDLQERDPFKDKGSTKKFDRAYWVARLLLARGSWPGEPARILDAYHSPQDRTQVFREADDRAWERLRRACQEGRVRIRAKDASDAQTALRPMRFDLDFGDPALDGSYFVLNVLRYEWHFEFTPTSRALRRVGRAPLPEDVRSEAPRITYVVPEGRLRVNVRITVRDRPELGSLSDEHAAREPRPQEVAVGPDRERRWRSADWAQLALTLCLGLVALVTSLPALYLSKLTFGSFADYTAILLWAVGLEVGGKNLVQVLRSAGAGGAPAPGK